MAEQFAVPRRQDRAATESLESQIKKVLEQYESAARPGRLPRYYTWSENELFYKGIQLFTIDQYDGSILRWEEEDQDLYHVVNITLPFVEMNSVEYLKSHPRFVVYSKNGVQDRRMAEAIEEAQFVVDSLSRHMWPTSVTQKEARLAQLRGWVFGQIYWDPKKGPKRQIPRMVETQVPLPGLFACPECGTQGELGVNEEMYACPECGSPMLQQTPGQVRPGVEVEGYDEVPAGDWVYEIVDAFNVEVWDRAETVADSPWLKYEDLILRDKAKQMYPWVDVSQSTDTWSGRDGLSGSYFKRQLELLISNTGELDQNDSYNHLRRGRGVDETVVLHAQQWLDKVAYAEIRLARNAVLPGTKVELPQGSVLGNVFDKGLKICQINGQIVYLDNEDKNDRWDGYQFQPAAAGFWSMGIENMIAVQKAFNETGSIELAAALYASMGLTLVDSSRLKDGEYVNRPGFVGVVEDRYPGESLDDIIHHVSTRFPVEVEALRQSYKADAQFISGARAPNTSGMSPEGMRTARGVAYQQATADSFSAARLELMAEYRARMLGRALKLVREKSVFPRYMTKFGETKGRWLDPLDIPEDLHIDVEEDTHHPRSAEDTKRDTTFAIQLGWGNPATSPFVNEHLAKIHNLPAGPDDYSDWVVLAERRVEEMREALGQLEQMGLPPEAVVMALVQVGAPRRLDNHAQFLRFYQELYLSDEFHEGSPLFQAAVEQLVDAHMLAAAGNMSEQMQLQDAAEAPVREGHAEEEGAKADRDAERDIMRSTTQDAYKNLGNYQPTGDASGGGA